MSCGNILHSSSIWKTFVWLWIMKPPQGLVLFSLIVSDFACMGWLVEMREIPTVTTCKCARHRTHRRVVLLQSWFSKGRKILFVAIIANYPLNRVNGTTDFGWQEAYKVLLIYEVPSQIYQSFQNFPTHNYDNSDMTWIRPLLWNVCLTYMQTGFTFNLNRGLISQIKATLQSFSYPWSPDKSEE